MVFHFVAGLWVSTTRPARTESSQWWSKLLEPGMVVQAFEKPVTHQGGREVWMVGWRVSGDWAVARVGYMGCPLSGGEGTCFLPASSLSGI